jgi:hypothetical protein
MEMKDTVGQARFSWRYGKTTSTWMMLTWQLTASRRTQIHRRMQQQPLDYEPKREDIWTQSQNFRRIWDILTCTLDACHFYLIHAIAIMEYKCDDRKKKKLASRDARHWDWGVTDLQVLTPFKPGVWNRRIPNEAEQSQLFSVICEIQTTNGLKLSRN